jgi:hypothetical protein
MSVCPVCDVQFGHAWNCSLNQPSDRDGNPKGGDACGSVHDGPAIAQPTVLPSPNTPKDRE